jgi:hypothetical protein
VLTKCSAIVSLNVVEGFKHDVHKYFRAPCCQSRECCGNPLGKANRIRYDRLYLRYFSTKLLEGVPRWGARLTGHVIASANISSARISTKLLFPDFGHRLLLTRPSGFSDYSQDRAWQAASMRPRWLPPPRAASLLSSGRHCTFHRNAKELHRSRNS